MPNKGKRPKASRRSMLIEPSVEEEALSHQCRLFGEANQEDTGKVSTSHQNVIHPSQSYRKQTAEGKKLVRLLTILFGSLAILVICSIASHNAAQIKTNGSDTPAATTVSSTLIKLLPTTTTAQPDASTTTTESEETGNATTSASASAGTEALEEGENTEPPPTVSNIATNTEEEDLEEPVSSGGRSLDRKLLIDSASDAADNLLARMKPAKATDDKEGESSDEETSTNQPDTESDVSIESNNDVDRSTAEALTSSEKQDSNNTKSTLEEAQLKHALEIYAKWRAAGDDIIELFSRKMLPVIVEHGYDVDSVTVTGLLQVFNGIRAIKPWALKLLDASAKISPGLLVGTQSDFGDFDECLNIREDDPSGLGADLTAEVDEVTGLKSSTLVGRYCLADVEFPKPPRVRLAERNEELQTDYAPIELRRPLLNFSETVDFKGTIFVETANFFHMLYVDPIRVGLCLTNKIDPQSFAKVLNQLVKEFGVSINFHDRCVTKYDKPIWTTKQKVSAYILLVACSLVLICTALDLLHAKLNKWPLPRSLDFWKKNLQRTLQRHRPLFTSFSIIRNTRRLFKAQQAPATRINQAQSNSSSHNANSSKPFTASSSSSESSPSIERRGSSSPASSAMNLISGTSSELSGSSSGGQFSSVKTTNHLLAQFDQHPATQKVLNAEQKVISGSKNLQKVDNCGRDVNLVCLHGIRVITMTWMIVNHTYLFGGFFVLWAHRRLIDIAEWPKSLSFQLVLNGWLTVETYFFLSAAIIVLNALPLMKARRFNYLTYIFHRLVRLIPAYVGLVSLNFLWPLISSGPVWLVKGKSFIQTPCENYLWTNFLFINNWIWPEKQCMVHTWFLSADFQLYLLAPVLVYLLYRRPVLGHSTNIIVAILASVFSGFVIYANKLMPTTLINKLEFDSIKQQLSYSYFATYQHMGPYCLGIFIGYLLYKRPNVKLPRHVTWILWILLPPLSFTTLLLTYLWNGAYNDPNLINPSPLVSALYVAIHRTIWTSLLAWIVFACATGRAKLMSNFLSHSMFIPLSRLSFSIYLVHLPVIMFRALNLRHTVEWTDSNILWEACGNFIASIVIGYFVNVTFESPIINLEQVIFGKPGERCGPALKGGKSGNLHLIVAGGKLHNNSGSLMPQLISVSKTSSDNDSCDDSKSSTNTTSDEKQLSEGDDQASIICESQVGQTMTATETEDGFTTPTTEGSPQLSHQRQPLQWTKSKESFAGSLESSIDGRMVEPLSRAEDNAQLDQVNTERQVTPGGIKPSRKFLAQQQRGGSDDSIGSTIYPISAREYQNYLAKPRLGKGDLRTSQYATLARTSRFIHDETISPMDRLEKQRQLYYPSKSRSHLGSSISASTQDADAIGRSSSRNGNHYRQSQLHSRRQSRYNTLTGLGSREWRRDYVESLGRLDSSQHDWQGWMIPRVDSSTLRRQVKRNEAMPPAGSIIEEHEDVGL